MTRLNDAKYSKSKTTCHRAARNYPWFRCAAPIYGVTSTTEVLILARKAESGRLENPHDREFFEKQDTGGIPQTVAVRLSAKLVDFASPPVVTFQLQTETNVVSANPNKPNDDRRRTILIVDDFDDTRLLLRTWLQKKGFRVVEAENGNRAIAATESNRPDLIIMDVEMPELDGLSATRKIRELKDFAAVPIVAVSAYGADQYRGHALAAGCNEYVSTPFEPEELEKLIRALIK